MHIPVLLHRALEILEPKPKEFFIDATLGGGGHAREIIQRIKPDGIFLGIDLSAEAIARCKSEMPGDGEIKIFLKQGNFADLTEIVRELKLPLADGLLLDLGFSSIELEAGRGFSFSKDEPLLMTYDEKAEPLWQKLKRLSQEEIYQIIKMTGERYARKISQEIYRRERKDPIKTTSGLTKTVLSAVPKYYEKGRIHPATRTFLAFRIFINQELENLERVLKAVPEILKPTGRLAVIAFQSLEDRVVKKQLRQLSRIKAIKLLNKKPLQPTRDEIIQNPRARSAKLRAAVRL